MNYLEFRDHCFDLLNQRSSNGVILDNLYNDQSDYVLRIPSLYNAAVTAVSNYCDYTGIIDKELCVPEPIGGGYVRICVPDDYIRMMPVLMTGHGRPYRCNAAYDLGGPYVAVREDVFRRTPALQYVRTPVKLPTEVGADIDHILLDGTEEQQHAAALWVCAHLVLDENAYISERLNNEFADWVDEMKSRRTAETTYTPDAYGLDGLYGGEWY